MGVTIDGLETTSILKILITITLGLYMLTR